MTDRDPRIITPRHNSEYFVAFKRRDTGVITWSTYPSKQEFEQDLVDYPNILEREEVLAQGISEAECIELTRTTPMSAYRASAFAEATGSDGLNYNILARKLEELNLMRAFGLIENNDLERDED